MGTKIYNSELTNELREGAKIQVGTDGIPSELAEKVIPVMEVNPKLMRRVNFIASGNSGTSAAAVTVLAADANNDTFITHFIYSLIKDATCDSATGNFQTSITINGVTSALSVVSTITLTAQDKEVSLSLNTPIKIDKNSTVRFTMPTFTAGVCRVALTIAGYKVYNTGA